jgi:hypothetical protein
MKKKKTRKSKATKLRDLPAKKLNAKTAKGVKGGEVSLNYGKIKYEYKEQ